MKTTVCDICGKPEIDRGRGGEINTIYSFTRKRRWHEPHDVSETFDICIDCLKEIRRKMKEGKEK